MVKPIYESVYPLLNVIETKSLGMKHIVLMKNEELKETLKWTPIERTFVQIFTYSILTCLN